MKNIIIGDEHCRGKFKKIYDKISQRTDIDNIVCTGDYFDPYDEYTIKQQMDNFDAIINIAKNDKRVKLLLGNHDMHYLINTGERSRMSYFDAPRISAAFSNNFDLFNLCFEIDKNTIVSHAGISPAWMKLYDLSSIEDINNLLKYITVKNENIEKYKKAVNALRFNILDYSGYGDDPRQPITWIRPNALIEQSKEWQYKIQIVGHTRTDNETSKDWFIPRHLISNYDDLRFDGNVETLNIIGSDKQLIMVDTGENIDSYLDL